jgi:hypothetical protein
MGLWVLRERKRDFGVGAAMDDGEKRFFLRKIGF